MSSEYRLHANVDLKPGYIPVFGGFNGNRVVFTHHRPAAKRIGTIERLAVNRDAEVNIVRACSGRFR